MNGRPASARTVSRTRRALRRLKGGGGLPVASLGPSPRRNRRVAETSSPVSPPHRSLSRAPLGSSLQVCLLLSFNMPASEMEAPASAHASAAAADDSQEDSAPTAAVAAAADEAQPAAAAVPALYVGDLHEDVAEEHLFEAFSKIGTVTSVRVCRDNATSRSLRYGYVNYFSRADAVVALDKLNHSLVLDKPIRVMWSNRDPDARRSGVGNIFVKNLSSSVDNASLQELFSKFGDVLSCKVAKNEDGTSRGYGFVQFTSQESADEAIGNLNGSLFNDRKLHVATFIKKSERSANNDDKFTNLYMKHLDDDITEELVKLKFSQFGSIVSVKIMKRPDGSSLGFGFVSFQNPESAIKAQSTMNGMLLGSKALYVARAQKKEERKQYLQRLHEEKRNEIMTRCNESNVYIKNIHDEVDDDALRARFVEFGNITSAKVMRDDKGISRGFGFVCYSTPEEAKSAVNNMRGVMFFGKPLYVAIFQRKEERKAKLQQHFAQLARMVGPANSMIPTGYPQVYFAHPSTHIPQGPPRHGFVYPPMGLSHEWRPSMFPPAPNLQQIHSPVMPNSPRHYRSNRGRMGGNMMPLPHAVHTMNYMTHPQPAKEFMSLPRQRFNHPKYFSNDVMANSLAIHQSDPVSTMNDSFSNYLASAPPAEQKNLLGNRLYPLVERHQPELASKITGMLLELDNSEVVTLLCSSEMLSVKVDECVQLLQATKPKAEDHEALHPGFMLEPRPPSVNAS
ncbi:polyadenylate-binding protein 7 [Zea mays]|uniref:Polyadenylate-binding protein n=2 Tax=Zea mays TaxID=4577 RepID=K7VF25_MAIZE|nr:polyadenylate-binding protein 7 [Zea mays]AQL07617.1 Polyadenylate-binding protein 7 [Zea mays]|eukprot:XP_008660294.1 polyadenylate-binding protein 7 [Zea mays]